MGYILLRKKKVSVGVERENLKALSDQWSGSSKGVSHMDIWEKSFPGTWEDLEAGTSLAHLRKVGSNGAGVE